jgi:hypothetical protein
MTPDDMEGRLYDALNAAELIGMSQKDLSLAVILLDAVNRCRALLLDYQERGRALEEANARIGVMTGRGERCPQCADTKRDCANAIAAMAVDFNRARATLKGKSHD